MRRRPDCIHEKCFAAPEEFTKSVAPIEADRLRESEGEYSRKVFQGVKRIHEKCIGQKHPNQVLEHAESFTKSVSLRREDSRRVIREFFPDEKARARSPVGARRDGRFAVAEATSTPCLGSTRFLVTSRMWSWFIAPAASKTERANRNLALLSALELWTRCLLHWRNFPSDWKPQNT